MNLFELFVKIEADDRASKTIEKISKNLGNGLSTAAKIGTAAVAAASAAIIALTRTCIVEYSKYEQLVGGMKKIFSDMDTSRIAQDAANAYITMGMSASEYLAIINDVGASFSATMGDERGYEAAKKGLSAISDYASGTGKNFNELQQKLAMITRSTSSYQSIADQFSGILPATSKGFLEQAQAAGILSTKYKKLTDVPIDEYQRAVTEMLALGVDALGLTGNTAAEAAETVEGSLNMMSSAWKNLVVGMTDSDADMDVLIDNFVESVKNVAKNILPKISKTFSGIGKLITELSPVIAEALPVLVEESLPELLAAGVSLVTSIVSGIITAIPALGEAILEAVETILVDVFGVSEEKAGEFSEGVRNAFADIRDFFTGVVEQINTDGTWLNEVWTKLQTVGQLLGEILVGAFEAIQTAFTWLAEQVNTDGTLLNTLWTGIQETVTFLLDACILAFDSIKSAFSSLVEDANTEGTWLNDVWTGLQETAQALSDFLTALWDAVSSAFTWCVEQINTEGTALNTIWETIQSVAEVVWTTIQTIISAAIDIIQGIIQTFTAILKGDWDSAWESVKSIASTAFDAVCSVIGSLVEWIAGFLGTMVEKGTELITSLSEGIQNKFTELFTAVGTWVTENIIDPIANMATDLFNAGVDLLNSFWDGLESVWDSIVSWWDGLVLEDKEANVNVNKNTSGDGYATGLSYVPYDEFPAILHRGEAVLTASEANRWRKYGLGDEASTSMTGGIVINQYIQSVPQTPVEFASATEAYFEQARWML